MVLRKKLNLNWNRQKLKVLTGLLCLYMVLLDGLFLFPSSSIVSKIAVLGQYEFRMEECKNNKPSLLPRVRTLSSLDAQLLSHYSYSWNNKIWHEVRTSRCYCYSDLFNTGKRFMLNREYFDTGLNWCLCVLFVFNWALIITVLLRSMSLTSLRLIAY